MDLSRRKFLGTTAGAVLAAGTMANGTVFGANKRVGVLCCGINGRGGSHIRAFSDMADSEVVALCDVDEKVLERRVNEIKEATGKKPKGYTDIREALDDRHVDVCTIATPNHWHSLAAIWACQAGKDVYVEKPICHNVYEGRQVIAAARKYGRVVQHGTQARSDKKWIRAMQRMKEGVIGDVYMARGLCYKNRNSIGYEPDKAPPEYLDWNLWQGPAQERSYNANYVHYNWHWFWSYGNGDIGNQGVHQMDVACWGLNRGLPRRITSMGGRYTYNDQGQTPNTQTSNFEYDDGTMFVFEVRGRATNDEGGVRVGNLFYGAEGYMADARFYDKNGKEIPDDEAAAAEATADVADSHFATFLNAVINRDQTLVRGSAVDGHISASHCHLANIAYRAGEMLQFDPSYERFEGSGASELNKMLTRDYRSEFQVPNLA